MRRWIAAALGGGAALALLATALFGWLVLGARLSQGDVCDATTLSRDAVPPSLVPMFSGAAQAFGLGPDGPILLAALTKVESDFGRNLGPSSAGAIGWTQFLPQTWRQFAVDGDDDGHRDPMNAADAIYTAARYLRHLGAPADWRAALYGYNHADWYVEQVLAAARGLRGPLNDGSIDVGCLPAELVGGAAGRLVGGGRIVAIPGQPGQTIDERIVRDVVLLCRRFHLTVTAGYAPTGHEAGGEHPLGLAVDLVPAPDGSWDDVDALARWAEPRPNHPRPPFRWVGYDGDAGHGRGDHLHLSWQHGPAPGHQPAAPWVDVLTAGATT